MVYFSDMNAKVLGFDVNISKVIQIDPIKC